MIKEMWTDRKKDQAMVAMCDHCPINHLPVKVSLPHWLGQLSHWAMISAVRVFLLTGAALLGTLLLNGTVQVGLEGQPLLDAVAALIAHLDP